MADCRFIVTDSEDENVLHRRRPGSSSQSVTQPEARPDFHPNQKISNFAHSHSIVLGGLVEMS
jgi:hypothetical protein